MSAFSAIFACVLPSPYLGLPGSGHPRRPDVQLSIADDNVGALVSWQLPCELSGQFVHEILYGITEYEDEFASCARAQQDNWTLVPCGVLEPLPQSEGQTEAHFEHRVPGLQ